MATPSPAHTATGTQLPAGMEAGEAWPPQAQLPGSCHSSWSCSRAARAEPELPGRAQPWSPSLPRGTTAPKLGHSRIPLPPPARETPPGTALDLGELASKALAPLCPSGCPALTSLLGTGGFQNTDTAQGEVSTLTQGFVVKVRIWKLFTPQWVIQT